MMRRLLAALVVGIALCSPAAAQSDADVLTLYRNSVVDGTMRIHVATFDSSDGRDYNAENCDLAANLFQRQEGISVRFWCEPGHFRR